MARWLDEFLLNTQTRVNSGPVPKTSRNLSRENQGRNEDRSQNAPHPEVEVSLSQSSQELSPEETSYRGRLFFFFVRWHSPQWTGSIRTQLHSRILLCNYPSLTLSNVLNARDTSFVTFCNGNKQKIYLFSKKLWNFGPKFFMLRPLKNLPNQQVAGSNCSISYVFLYFIPESLRKHNLFFKHQNQLCPMSILNHTGDANSGHSWLVQVQKKSRILRKYSKLNF